MTKQSKSNSRLLAAAGLAVILTLIFPASTLRADTYDPNYVTRAGNSWFVTPTGTDDRANLQGAFDEASAVFAATGASDIVVHLAAGTFYLSDALGLRNWSGTIKGEGKGITVLTNVLGSAWSGVERVDGNWVSFLVFNLDENWDYSVAADIAVSGLSFQPIGGPLAPDWPPLFNGISVLGDDTPSNPGLYKANIEFHDLGFVGQPISGLSPTNLAVPFGIYDGWWGGPSYIRPMEANLSVTAIDAENVFVLMDAWGLFNGYIAVGGSARDKVTVTNAIYTSFEFGNPSGSTFDISYLETQNASGIYFLGYSPYWASPDFPFISNYVEIYSTSISKQFQNYAAIEIWDAHPEENSSFYVHNNSIYSEYPGIWGPIWLSGTRHALVANNIISGRGPAAIVSGLVGGVGGGDYQLTLLGNNVQGWETVSAGSIPAIAPIWLGWGTSYSTVVGNGKNVVDEGTNNSVTGMTHLGPVVPPDTLGQDISDVRNGKTLFQ